MARGHALLVGLKSVNPASYGGWDGRGGCYGCELDVDNVARILEPMEYTISELKTQEAISSNVLRGLRAAAETLVAGDIFVFYYSGHGGQQPDFDGDELDGHDETLVLYDREVIDDELNEVWEMFRAGVRIVMISDSCNSGSNYRGFRDVSASLARPIRLGVDRSSEGSMAAQMIHFSGCRDGGVSNGYLAGGAFTMAFCKIWADGDFIGTYPTLYEDVRILVRNSGERQEPQYNTYGPVSNDFESSRPFSVITRRMPTQAEIKIGLSKIPISWLHQPSLAEKAKAETANLRVAPLVAAAIGVAVGAGIQLGSQALARFTEINETNVSKLRCSLSYFELEQLALANARQIDLSRSELLNDCLAAAEGARPLPVAAAAFLAGVAAGAAAARP